jgi:formiminoglutamase
LSAASLSDDPNWPRASAWLRGSRAPDVSDQLAILGAPLRLGSITPGRCDLAPQALRKLLSKFSTYDVASDIDLQRLAAKDLGDLDLADARPEEAFAPITDAVRNALREADALVLLGGDNSITRAGCHGAGSQLERCGLLTLDAHLDLRDTRAGLINGNPVRALLDDGLPGANIVQVGIQSFANSRAYAEIAVAAGIKVVTIDEVRARSLEEVVNEALDYLERRVDNIYFDLDLDVLDRIYAPATPGSRPGGLTPFELRRAAKLCGQHRKVRVMDLVEIDPTQDIADATLMTAAACLLSFASGLLRRLANSSPNE